MNKRKLKKAINGISAELITYSLSKTVINNNEETNQKADAILDEIIALNNEFLKRISHPEPGNIKGSYKKLYADFDSQSQKIVDDITSL